MTHANAAGQLGDFEETLLDGVLEFLGARLDDLQGGSGEFGVPHPLSLSGEERGTFFQSLVIRTVLVVLEQVDLFGESDDEIVDPLLEFGAVAEDRIDRSAGSCLHAGLIGAHGAGL